MINRILKIELVGEDVKLLQNHLTEIGIYKREVSGHFDTYTKNCVTEYQINNGLEPNGIVTIPVWYSIISMIQLKNIKEEVKKESKKSTKKHE